ncbi:MAG: TIGR02646 family protein [Puniceicoccales bacterium]|jgi:uncharacterized protein (TIGR02646 family)|nr:TIGR02646 family protein [Puniceicoccales bacterium]
MRAFKRAAEPEVLQKNGEQWGNEWATRKAKDPSAKFHWHEQDGESVNKILLPLLETQTQAHCSFCDCYAADTDTIEHFQPKSTHPKLAFQWDNLYLCCHRCQRKGEKFDEALLRPDAEGYDFNRYFRWSYTRGHLLPNENATADDQKRAQTTIALYQLNIRHPHLRCIARKLRKRCKDMPLDEFPYRNFIDPKPVDNTTRKSK